MFNTIFYSFLLIIQLFISDDSNTYNLKIERIGNAIKSNNFQKAITLTNDLNSQSLFYNYELENLLFLLSLKSGQKVKRMPKVNRKLFKTIQFFENGKQQQALDLLKLDISKNPVDSVIKWYEILDFSNRKYVIKSRRPQTNPYSIKSFNEKEALELLDLMKNKEKYIKYELSN